MMLLEDILNSVGCASYELYVDRTEQAAALNLDLFDTEGEYKGSYTIAFTPLEKLSSKEADNVKAKLEQTACNLNGLLCPVELYVVSHISYDSQENPVPCVFDKFYRTRKAAEDAIKEFREGALNAATSRNINTSKTLELSDSTTSVRFNTVDVAKHSEFLIKKVKLI